MNRTRITLMVTVDLDPIRGSFHTPESVRNVVSDMLDDWIGHYHPVVSLLTEEYTDQAIFVTENMTKEGGIFFGTEDAFPGWFLVVSTDPAKKALSLPPHIFRKCFQWVDEEGNPDKFRFVKEIV